MYKQLKKSVVWFSRKRVLLFVLIFSLALLGAAIYLFTKQNNWLEDEFAKQVQNIELNKEITELSLYIKNAESAERGYAISDNRVFVEKFGAGIDSIRAIYKQVQQLEKRNEDHTDAVLFLASDSLVKQKIAFMQRVKKLCDNNDCKAAAALIATNQGEKLSDSIALINRQINANVQQRLKNSQTVFSKIKRNNSNLAFAGIIASMLLIMLIFSLLFKALRKTKKISDELYLRKENYRVTLNSLGEGLISTDEKGRITYMNPSAEQLTGWRWQDAKEQLLQQVFDVVNEQTGKPIEHIVSRILKDGKKIDWENNTVLRAKNNAEFIISNNGSAILDVNGHTAGAVLLFNDITEKYKIERQLKDSERQYRDLIQNLPEAVYTCDASGYIKLYNKAAVDLWGREPIPGKDLWCGSWKIFNTDGTDLPLDSGPMAITLKEGIPVLGKEIMVQRPDESYRHVLPYPSPLFNAEGKLTGAINMLIDVTDKKEREILIQKTEEKYRNLVEQASDAILIYSFDGTIHEFNKACYTMLGYSKEEYAKLKLTDILVDEIIVNQDNYAAILAGETKTLYRNLMRKDGSLLETEVTVKTLADGSAIAFARDITERKKAEELVRKNEKKFRALVENNNGIIVLTDENFKTFYRSPSAERITGRTNDELAGMGIENVTHPDDTKKLKELWNDLIANPKKLLPASLRFLHKNGSYIFLEGTAINLLEDENVKAIVINVLDVTQRKKAEAKTKSAIERYDILADATSDTIWDWDIVNSTMLYNDGIYKMFGYKASEVENVVDWWNEKLHSDDFKKVTESLDDIFEKGVQRFQLTYRFRCADGSYKYIFDRAFVIFDGQGKPVRMIGAMQDITYQTEEEIRVAKAIIDAQEQERNYLGAELHDNINQILAGTLLTLGMAKSKQVDTRQQSEFIESAIGYITDALNETRKLSHNLAPASFDDNSLKDLFENLLLNINLENLFTVSFDFEELKETIIPENIEVNLYRILQEQTKNILKYSEASTIEIAVKIIDKAVRLRIHDNGKGFDTKAKKTGIGLSNIKKRVDALSGKFILNSAPGKGCEIIVEVPLSA